MKLSEVKPEPAHGAPTPKLRRFYKVVNVINEDGALRVVLDGKPIRTPRQNILETRKQAIAEAIAKEWDSQEPFIDRETMVLTRMVTAVIDCIGSEREAIISGLMSYIDSDLLCYRAVYPTALKVKQDEAWQPVLDWLKESFGACFTVIYGIMPERQSADTVVAMKQAIDSLTDENLAAFQACASVTKSLSLSMALVHGYLDAEEVSLLAQLDERFQAEQWGEDQEEQIRRQKIDFEINRISNYINILRN
ncbi:MAG TPA: ATPase [Rhodospirillaceae bacterium]|nr:ATPase [Candidatus Neomarinimicrobiota bacterium]HCX13759.1 ATPase [Rhodospirillaceae bacterium]